MVFSHHSHSGQFCHHAKNTLEECIQAAISANIRTFALTEHMPRSDARDLYPEEIQLSLTTADLKTIFREYYNEALRLRKKYSGEITVLIGFETDFIRPEYAVKDVRALLDGDSGGGDEGDKGEFKWDLFVGSVHHVNGIPVDFDYEMFERAILDVKENGVMGWGVEIPSLQSSTTPPHSPHSPSSSPSSPSSPLSSIKKEKEEGKEQEIHDDQVTKELPLYEAYFDAQYVMLSQLQPPIIGHFDLIRLLSRSTLRTSSLSTYPTLWSRIIRNVDVIVSINALVELNTAALRKGMTSPYPGPDILQLMKERGVRFCLSDDSHGVAQIGYGFSSCLGYLKENGVRRVSYYDWRTRARGLDGKLQGLVDADDLPGVGDVEVREVDVDDVLAVLKDG